jgi:hypothetical protein
MCAQDDESVVVHRFGGVFDDFVRFFYGHVAFHCSFIGCLFSQRLSSAKLQR